MNDERRKVLQKILEGLNLLYPVLEGAKDDESDAYENMPEGLRNSERGEQAQIAVENLGEALDFLSSCRDKIEEVLGS